MSPDIPASADDFAAASHRLQVAAHRYQRHRSGIGKCQHEADDRRDGARVGEFDIAAEVLAVEELVAAAREHGDVLYAVPGSPLILESTVALLRADPRVEVVVVAGGFVVVAVDGLVVVVDGVLVVVVVGATVVVFAFGVARGGDFWKTETKKPTVSSEADEQYQHWLTIADGLAIESLRRFKDDATEVKTDFECGIGLGKYNDIQLGDEIETIEMKEKPRV